MKKFSKRHLLEKDEYYYSSEGYVIFTEKYHLKGVIVATIIASTAHTRKPRKRKRNE